MAEGDDLTFEKALEAALLIESAEHNVKSLHTGPEGYKQGEVNFVKRNWSSNTNKCSYNKNRPKDTKSSNGPKAYFRCGKDRHDSHSNPYKGYACNLCKKKGHLAAVCFQNKGKDKYRAKSNVGLNFCEESDEEFQEEHSDWQEESHSQLFLNTIAYANNSIPRPNNFVTKMWVKGIPLDMVIDTGAVVSCMPDNVYFDKFQNSVPDLRKVAMSLKTYTGEKINILGEFQAKVT